MSAGVFSSILTSCIEVYPRETIGLLGGYPTKRRNILVMAYPVQLAKRRRNEVQILNRKNQDRTLRIFKSLGIQFYGFYHSHSNGIAKPSEQDLLATVEEILRLKKKMSLLEIVIQIHRKKYKRKQRPNFWISQSGRGGGAFTGSLIAPRNRYDFIFVGEWVEVAPLDYEVVPNRYQAKMRLIESEVNKGWMKE
jgi:proteasome lid subunit RPN8/RPN11